MNLQFNILVATLSLHATPLAEYYSELPQGTMNIRTLFATEFDDIPNLTDFTSPIGLSESDIISTQGVINSVQFPFDEVFIRKGELPYTLENWISYYCEMNSVDLTVVGDASLDTNNYLVLGIESGYYFVGKDMRKPKLGSQYPKEVYKMLEVKYISLDDLLVKINKSVLDVCAVNFKDSGEDFISVGSTIEISKQKLIDTNNLGNKIRYYYLSRVEHPKEVMSLYSEIKVRRVNSNGL